MPGLSQQSIHRILDGSDRSVGARFLRGMTALAEPFYSSVVLARNSLYDHSTFKSHSLSRPTISVGNITTGGTGKTPVVAWLAARLRDSGRHPAVLLRGYRSSTAGISDEEQVLDRSLNSPGVQPIPVRANPSRIESAARLLKENSAIDAFVLDDAFQHRKARRDFDLVLISATDPFGFNHVLPRGLLREPLGGLRRAGAFLVTRASEVDPAALQQIETKLARLQPAAPIYRADHVHASIRSGQTGERLPMDSLCNKNFYAFCGIANPSSFDLQLRSTGGECVGHAWYPDHHDYTAAELREIIARAATAGAGEILTTEKDWVKLAALPDALHSQIPISVVELQIQFSPGHEERLLAQVLTAIPKT